MLEYIAFLSCLEFAVLNSMYCNMILKPKQVICLESIFLQKDVLCVLPTGYGKSLIFHLAPMLLFAKGKLDGDFYLCWKWRRIASAAVDAIVIVVSPLNSLMSNQISRLSLSGIRASVVSVKASSSQKGRKKIWSKSTLIYIFAKTRSCVMATITSSLLILNHWFPPNMDEN